MKLYKKSAEIFVPDSSHLDIALSRTTHLAIAAHHDDIELMAYNGIVNCFGKTNRWFSGVVVTDGAGSARSGIYANYTDEDMKNIRVVEQKKAAYVGEYSTQFLLGFSSSEVKDPNNDIIIKELENIILATKPEVIYTHNPADKHDTHCGVLVKVIAALRNIKDKFRPKKVYGCEVWRNLDWVVDSQKVQFDNSAHPNIAMGLVSVFDSQITGGKRYDLAAEGRRVSNATYSASHDVDAATAVNYAIDLTSLIDGKQTIIQYITEYIDNLKKDVTDRLKKLTNI